MRPVILLLALLYFLFCTTGMAAEYPWKNYVRGVFSITYQTQGENAVSIEDSNHNGIPDRVEDLATQMEAARALYQDVLHCNRPKNPILPGSFSMVT